MAVKSKEDLLKQIEEVLPNTDDKTLGLIEDISDSFTDLETKSKDQTDWKKKYDENDAAWRQKYKDRFFNSGAEESEKEDPPEVPEEIKPSSYDDLFKEPKKEG